MERTNKQKRLDKIAGWEASSLKTLLVLVFLIFLTGCVTLKKEHPVPEWYLEIPEDNESFIYGKGTSRESLKVASRKARGAIIQTLGCYIKIYHPRESNLPKDYKEILMKEIEEFVVDRMEIVETDSIEGGFYYILMKLSKQGLEKDIEWGFSALNQYLLSTSPPGEGLVTFEDSQGNLIRVWITKSDYPYKTAIIEGVNLGVDPQNPGFFLVDLEPCKECGQVSIPGSVIKIKEVDRVECENGKSYKWNRIVYQPE